jgi:predicted phage-related endonuclease
MEMTGRREMLPASGASRSHEASGDHWTRVLETILSAHYRLRTGCKLHPARQTEHPQHSWMLGGGAQSVCGSTDVQLLLCVAAGVPEAAHWSDEMPLYVRARALHELVVASARALDVMVLVGGRDLQVHRVHSTAEAAKELLAQEQAFWQCVQSQRPPPVDLAMDPRLLLALPIERLDRAYAALDPAH